MNKILIVEYPKPEEPKPKELHKSIYQPAIDRLMEKLIAFSSHCVMDTGVFGQERILKSIINAVTDGTLTMAEIDKKIAEYWGDSTNG